MKTITPDLVPAFVRPWFRTREMCLAQGDWRAFADVLATQYPYARYIRGTTGPERLVKAIPDIRLERHLSALIDADGRISWEIQMGFDPDWQPNFRLSDDTPSGWRRDPLLLPHLRFLAHSAFRAAGGGMPEHLPGSRIEFSCEPGNQNHLSLARQLFGLLRRVATNRNQIVVQFPGYRISAAHKTSPVWLGHDAQRWVLQDPRRLLNYNGWTRDGITTGYGLRPAVDPDAYQGELQAVLDVVPRSS